MTYHVCLIPTIHNYHAHHNKNFQLSNFNLKSFSCICTLSILVFPELAGERSGHREKSQGRERRWWFPSLFLLLFLLLDGINHFSTHLSPNRYEAEFRPHPPHQCMCYLTEFPCDTEAKRLCSMPWTRKFLF